MEETQGHGGSYHGLAALFGDPKDQLAFSIFSLLPWLCLHYKHTSFTPVAQACILVSLQAFDRNCFDSQLQPLPYAMPVLLPNIWYGNS